MCTAHSGLWECCYYSQNLIKFQLILWTKSWLEMFLPRTLDELSTTSRLKKQMAIPITHNYIFALLFSKSKVWYCIHSSYSHLKYWVPIFQSSQTITECHFVFWNELMKPWQGQLIFWWEITPPTPLWIIEAHDLFHRRSPPDPLS